MSSPTSAVITPIALACALTVALLAGCGGSSGNSTPQTPAFAGVTLTGVAATGAALANAKVEAKCGSLSATATTAADGSYTLKMEGAALPCLLRATSADTATVLHSVADGSGAAAATANITPVTELLVAKAVGSASTPEAAFVANTPVTPAQLAAAKTAVVAALKPIVDLSDIDPISTAFKAASGSTAGDATDKKLDALSAALATGQTTLGALATAVVQAPDPAAAAAAVAAAVAAPPVAACPALRNGVYVSIDQRGKVQEHVFNLNTMVVTDADGSVSSLVPISGEACHYTVRDAQGRDNANVVFGAAGVGGFASAANNSSNDRAVGLVFPKQPMALADLVGDWNVVALDRDGGPSAMPQFGFAKASIAADGTAAFQACTSELGVASCNDPARKGTGSVAIDAKGQFALSGGSIGYGYRLPDGTQFVVTGKPNGDGMNVFVRATPIALPAAGASVQFWDVSGTVTRDAPAVFASSGLVAQSLSITSVDSAAGSYLRSDGKSFRINMPAAGLRYRPAGSANGSSWSATIGLPIKGVGTVYGKEKAANAGDAMLGFSIQRP